MPNLNGTGPRGIGPRTGRGMGNCAPGNNRRFGFGRGYGAGRGRARFFNPPQAIEQEEKQILQDELKALREETKQIESRLEELKKVPTQGQDADSKDIGKKNG